MKGAKRQQHIKSQQLSTLLRNYQQLSTPLTNSQQLSTPLTNSQQLSTPLTNSQQLSTTLNTPQLLSKTEKLSTPINNPSTCKKLNHTFLIRCPPLLLEGFFLQTCFLSDLNLENNNIHVIYHVFVQHPTIQQLRTAACIFPPPLCLRSQPRLLLLDLFDPTFDC